MPPCVQGVYLESPELVGHPISRRGIESLRYIPDPGSALLARLQVALTIVILEHRRLYLELACGHAAILRISPRWRANVNTSLLSQSIIRRT
jgi:hypothetical protein